MSTNIEEWDVQASHQGVILLLGDDMFILTPTEAVTIGDLLVTIGSEMGND